MPEKFAAGSNEKTFQDLFAAKILAAVLLLTVFAAAAFAQAGSSVMVYAHARQGTDAEAMSHVVRDKILTEMLDKFPCIDQFDDASLAALLGWERARQLLGQEPNAELMQSIAGAVGARYVVSVSATTLPNGQTYATVTVIDSQTGQTVSRADAPPTGAEKAVDAADALAQKVLRELAGIFKGRCDPHWAGTVSYSFKYQKGEQKTVSGSPGAMESNVVVNASYSDSLEDAVEAILQPMSQGTEGTKTMARVVHRYRHLYESSATRTSDIICRPKNANSYKTKTNGSSRETIDERGQNTANLPVYIYVNKTDGTYEISVDYPALTTARSESRSGVRGGCGSAEPFSDSSSGAGSPESEAYSQAGGFKVRGRIDPKNPDVLAGKEEKGDLENGLYTLTWNVRLVKPNRKKALQ